MQFSPIDLHIELSSLKNFINSQIDQRNPYLFYGKELFELLKRVVIDSETKPFLTFPKEQNEQPYYDNYLKRSNEQFQSLIPDFFEHEGEFYDLDRVLYVYKDFTRAKDFEKLFIIKLLELKSNDYSVAEFLSFQQYDSFYGQKESIDSFLYQLTVKDSNCRLLQETCQVLRDWIGSQHLAILKESAIENDNSEPDDIIENNNPDPDDTPIEKIDTQEQWNNEIELLRGKKIKCNWSIEQIKHYFSFLYQEKSENGEPYLKKEQVEKMFENGLRIPQKPIHPLFNLNCSLRYPVKNIKYAIYYFYDKGNNRSHDKLAYLLFFGSFIGEFKKYLDSKDDYKSFSSNSYKVTGRNKIAWDKYRPI